MITKVMSVSPTGRIRKTIQGQKLASMDHRLRDILNELGISRKEYEMKAEFRMLDRKKLNQFLNLGR